MKYESILAKMVYFEQWMTGDAVDLLDANKNIELTHLQFSSDQQANEDELVKMHGYQIMPRTELDPRYLADSGFVERMPKLLAICSTGAGYDMIDVDACTDAGIIVCNQSGTNSEAVAEHVFGFILGLSKKIMVADRAMRTVDRVDRMAFDGRDIFGKTIGIVGIGQIGTRVATVAKAFNMRVLAYDPYVPATEMAARGAEDVDWETLFSASDFISIHCPRTTKTLNMIDAPAFALMKPSAFFISTARGGIHNEDALAKALINGQIAGAGIDVWWEEPTPMSHPLLQLDNVIATPHCAGMTHESMQQMGIKAAEQWQDIFAGKVPPRLVNPQAWTKYRLRFNEHLGFWPDELSPLITRATITPHKAAKTHPENGAQYGLDQS